MRFVRSNLFNHGVTGHNVNLKAELRDYYVSRAKCEIFVPLLRKLSSPTNLSRAADPALAPGRSQNPVYLDFEIHMLYFY